MPDDSRLVYSSKRGRICPNCRRPAADCTCRASPRAPAGDGVVRMRREVKRGKTVIAIHGVPLPGDALRELAGDLKRRCGTGGSAKNGVIEIQGDHRDALREALEARGYRVVWSGG